MKIAQGWQQFTEPHPSVLPIDTRLQPGVQAPTLIADYAMAQMPERDLTGERIADLAVMEAACAAAQSDGMAADGARRTHYEADMSNSGPAEYGDQMSIPPPDYNFVPPASSPLQPFAGDEPPGI